MTNKYDVTGLLTNTFGSRTYPVAYTFDAQGRMKTMTTWKSFAAGSGTATTTWNYDTYRGWLTNKAYADAKGPSYTYTAGGRLASRTWARGTNAAYTYGSGGDLSEIDYNGGATPVVQYVNDRRGRLTYAYANGSFVFRKHDDAGQLLSETYQLYAPMNGLSNTNGYDHLLRRTNNVTLFNGAVLTTATNNYDAASRLLTVSDRTNSATYSYLANSPLVSQIDFKQNGTTRMSTAKSYDNLNRLTSIISTTNAVAVASFKYGYNPANQRTTVTNVDNSYWAYQYDSLGQVVSGKKYWSDGTPVAGQQFQYGFDDIGNRTATAAGGDQWGANLRWASYSANNLNQYTNRTVPGAVDVIGTATNTATVTVNNNPSYRKGSYYRVALALTNTAGPVWQSITNLAVLNNGTNSDIVTNVTGNVFLPQTPENFTYDADGNLTQDGRWQYTWDAENHLVSMQSISAVPTAAKLKLDFLYDYKGRRVQKLVSTNNGSAYYPFSTNRFVYDDWNLVCELGATNSNVLRGYTWGLDLSGRPQGAGGVGGLIEVNDAAGGANFVAFDGNGNIAALAKASDGTVSAQHEYGPFGEPLRPTGPTAKANPLRFSTKYQDDETDLLYYGYRYYNSALGRWPARDPVEERGGNNLYALLSNAAIGDYDPFGLLHDGQIIPVNYKGQEVCTARVILYGPVPFLAYNQRTILTEVGAQLRIEIQCDCSGCGGCFKWRQYFTETHDGEYTMRKGKLAKDLLDTRPPNTTEWYERRSDEPYNDCSYTFQDSPGQQPPTGMFIPSVGPVNRVAVSFRLELVHLSNCYAPSGGTPILSIRWGYWYTKDANGLFNWDPIASQ